MQLISSITTRCLETSDITRAHFQPQTEATSKHLETNSDDLAQLSQSKLSLTQSCHRLSQAVQAICRTPSHSELCLNV